MVTYFKNQKDLAQALITTIDLYWGEQLPESQMIENIIEIVNKNKDKMFNNNGYSSVIKQRLGKKRISLLDKIVNMMEG